MGTKKLTKTALIAAHDEIDKVVGIDPPIKEELKQEKYEKELNDTIIDLELSPAEIKGFSKETQAVVAALKEKFGAEQEEEDEDEPEKDEDEEEDEEEEVVAPAPKKAAKKVVPVVEEDEEDEEDDEDDEEELSLVDQILACKKLKEYQAVINENTEFKKDKKRLLAITSVFSLKKEMLAIVAPAKAEKAAPAPAAKGKKAPVVEDDDDEDDDEEAEEVKPAKKAAKTPVVKKEKDTRLGVIAFIAKCIEDSGTKGISRDDIYERLCKLYPERPAAGMLITVNAQISNRMSGVYWPIGKTKKGTYYKL